MQPSPSALARLVDGFAAEGIRFGRRQTTTRSLRLGERAVPTLEKKGTLRALVRQQPFVSIGRGDAPSGPLTSSNAIAASRRWGRASPQGVGRRRRAVPTPENKGRFAPWCVSTLRVNR